MGGCVSRDRNTRRRYRRPYSFRSSVTTTNGFVGRNKPLNPPACHPKWKSDVPITDNQLRRKREEYWDTAPAFEGRKEIWDALRGTCYAIEQNDIDLAQSILNCANISLPHGTLLDCYDELGTRYQLPVYVLSSPINLIDGERASMDSRADYESGTSDAGLTITVNTDRDRDYGGNQSSSSSSTMTQTQPSTTRRQIDERHNPILRRIKKHRQKHKSNIESGHETVLVQHQEQTIVEIPIKYRLSNGNEHRLYCKQNEKFRAIKKRLALLENGAIDSQVQRFFFGGKLLRDRATISETRLQRNFVVQVVLYEQPTVPEATITKTGELTIHDELTNQSYSTPNDSPNTTFNL